MANDRSIFRDNYFLKFKDEGIESLYCDKKIQVF